MGISGPLIVFTLVALSIAAIVSNGSNLQGTGSQPFCASNNGLVCTTSPSGVTYQCNKTSGSCILPYTCPNTIPTNTICTGGIWLLNAQSAVFIPNAELSNLGPTGGNGSNLVFAAITPTGFIVMAGFAASLIVFAALNFFGSGENDEGTHIAYISGMLLGLWGILSAAEGFIVDSPTSFFIELNGFIPGIGTLSYLFLSMFYCLGIIGTVSRSSGSGGGV